METTGTVWTGFHEDGAWLKFEHGADACAALEYGRAEFGVVRVERENGAAQAKHDADLTDSDLDAIYREKGHVAWAEAWQARGDARRAAARREAQAKRDTSAYDAMRARPNGEWLENRFVFVVLPNRARTAELRSRMLAKPGRFLTGYAAMRACGSTARDALALARSCSASHLAAWSQYNGDTRAVIIRDAAERFTRLFELLPVAMGGSARVAWRVAYRKARAWDRENAI